MASALFLGLVVGFPIAAAPGPMFFLVLRRTLERGWRSGLISGAGIASGDAIYAAIAAFGVVAIINLLVSQKRWMGLAGGIAIAFIGIRTLMAREPVAAPRPSPQGEGRINSELGDYSSTLGLTLSNPPTILAFIAVFAGLGVHVHAGWQPALALVIGVLLGSALWWFLLTAAAALLRRRISPAVTRAIGFAAGVALIAFGVVIAVQSL